MSCSDFTMFCYRVAFTDGNSCLLWTVVAMNIKRQSPLHTWIAMQAISRTTAV